MIYKQLFLDLDGTVYLSDQPIGGVISHLNYLQKLGVELFVLTNNTSVSRVSYHRKLCKMGLHLELANIVSPVVIVGEYLRLSFGIRPQGFIVGTKDFKDELQAEYDISHDENRGNFVLLSFDKTITYAKLQKACELISGGIPYYLTNIDIACPTKSGPIPDTGSLWKLVEAVTGIKPITHFGKPGELLANHLLSFVGKEAALLVGDRLYTDIVLGHKMGIDTLLVFSGETKPQDFDTGEFQPTHVANTLAEFLECQFIAR